MRLLYLNRKNKHCTTIHMIIDTKETGEVNLHKAPFPYHDYYYLQIREPMSSKVLQILYDPTIMCCTLLHIICTLCA